MTSLVVEELAWLARHPIVASRWWFRRLVIQRLNGETAAARRYEEGLQAARQLNRERDPYEEFTSTCPYDGTELAAPWAKCPICGRND